MNKVQKFDELDAVLYLAAQNAGRVDLHEYNSIDTEVTVSPRFERHIKRIIREFLRKQKPISPVLVWVKRVAVIILVMMASAFTLALSVEAVREALKNAIVEFFDTYMSIEYDTHQEKIEALWTQDESYVDEFSHESNNLTDQDIIMEYIVPDILEEQFEKVYDYRTHTQLTMEYEQGDIAILYNQYFVNNYKNQISYENAVISEISIGEYGGILVEQIIDGYSVRTLVWKDEEYAYTIYGNATKEVLITIAESIRKEVH